MPYDLTAVERWSPTLNFWPLVKEAAIILLAVYGTEAPQLTTCPEPNSWIQKRD
jgi:hypothetical protein